MGVVVRGWVAAGLLVMLSGCSGGDLSVDEQRVDDAAQGADAGGRGGEGPERDAGEGAGADTGDDTGVGTRDDAGVGSGAMDAGEDSGGGPAFERDPRGLCFDENPSDTVEVSSGAELAAAVATAPPGRHVLIAPGSYDGIDLELVASGAEGAPVVVRPRDGAGTVTVNGSTWVVRGTRLVISGLHFNDGRIELNGSFHRVSRNRFRQIEGGVVVLYEEATDMRVDHNDFSDYVSTESDKHVVHVKSQGIVDGTLRGLLFDYNHIHDINPTLAGNGTEPIGFGWTIAAPYDPKFVVDHCLLENISLPGEGEIIGAKTSGVVVSNSTFVDLRGLYLNAPRAGNGWEIRSCWFEGVGGSAALNVWGEEPLVIGNHFAAGTKMRVGAGDDSYGAAVNGRIIGNTMEGGTITVGGFWGSRTPTTPATDNVLEANVGEVVLEFETGTVQRETTSEPFTPAVKLTAADVGLEAGDPLCEPGG